jgi:hypothetical protein
MSGCPTRRQQNLDFRALPLVEATTEATMPLVLKKIAAFLFIAPVRSRLRLPCLLLLRTFQ